MDLLHWDREGIAEIEGFNSSERIMQGESLAAFSSTAMSTGRIVNNIKVCAVLNISLTH